MKFEVVCNIEDINSSIDEQKFEFLKYILSTMELPLDNIFPEGSSIYDFTLENKISLKELCKKYNLEIVDFSDGSQDIFLDGQKIGFWKRPKFKYKKDLTIMDKKKQLYAIIFVDCWSVFDEEE